MQSILFLNSAYVRVTQTSCLNPVIKMLKLRNIFNAPFHIKKCGILEEREIIRRCHVRYFESEDEIMENVLGRFITIGINLPDAKNVLTETALKKLNESIKNFDRNDEIRAAVLHGIGGNFCCGTVPTNDALQLSQNLLKTIHTVKKPIIAALEGYTVDFGVHMAAMCDMRIIDKLAQIGVQGKTSKLEVPPFLNERLILTLGLSTAFELLCIRQLWKASTCLTNGFANLVTDPGCSLGSAITFAQSIAFNNTLENIIEHKSKLLSFLKHK